MYNQALFLIKKGLFFPFAMKKIILLIILLESTFFYANAQLLRIDDQEMGFKGDIVEVPIYISNALNVSSFQGSFLHSSDLIFLEATSTEFIITTNIIDAEKVVYIGGDFLNPKTYTTEIIFMVLKFRIIATANIGFSNIELSDDPVPTNFFDDSFNPINLTFQNGGVHIQGLLSSSNKLDFNLEIESNQLVISGSLPTQMRFDSFIELANQEGIFTKQILIYSNDSSFFEVKIDSNNQFKYVRIRHKEYVSEIKLIPSLELEDVFSIYPNPVNEKLFYNISTKQNATIHLYDTKGILIITQCSDSQRGEIYLKNLPKGLYFLYYIIQDKTFTKKIIKL